MKECDKRNSHETISFGKNVSSSNLMLLNIFWNSKRRCVRTGVKLRLSPVCLQSVCLSVCLSRGPPVSRRHVMKPQSVESLPWLYDFCMNYQNRTEFPPFLVIPYTPRNAYASPVTRETQFQIHCHRQPLDDLNFKNLCFRLQEYSSSGTTTSFFERFGLLNI